MIRSFADQDTERVFRRERCRAFSTQLQRQAHRKLLLINAALSLQDLRSPPGNRLEALHGERRNQHSIRVNDQFRICFRWQDGDAYEVELVDYH